ncbi:DUF6344 domain-containing protein [Streptomyces sp. DSM 41972]|uniref:DUF6344 domain-containing protein n=2 Tax=Actinomycetes TaxID=1760 RepID=A0ABU3HW23_9ACTN|nr:DUF6344 domain-containing protein [Streptomyces sp. DSM 41972]SCD67447.1 hypothetical protein GA0115238_120064 [Streptomyces sp. di50b]SCD75498.1 hypothetical protein GA0115245_112563 [Streptomyces sp. di188]
MARNKVMQLWNVVVTAFLALCTALGLVTTTAAAAVPQTQKARNSDSAPKTEATTPTAAPWSWSLSRALPPTMKQRIHAEAHGKSPSCRHRPLSDTADEDTEAEQDSSTERRPDSELVPAHCSPDTATTLPAPASARIPLQR